MLALKKVLIANRGEIACRIIRTARKLGIASVAVYSDADRNARHVSEADEAVHIGPSPATDSYLRIDRILAAAHATGADCIHPGYGFLAENADFAEAVAQAGLVFIGPTPEAMRRMGGKAEAKAIAQAAGVPVVPGYNGEKQDGKTLAREAGRIGYPALIKAVAGGGGRGMRLVERAEDFDAALESAKREALASFGDDRVLIEKLIVKPRHIEVQVFGDAHGHVVHLYERDCSLQRRNQKVIEEAPAPGMSEALRARMTAAAIKCAKAVDYRGAGTVEFLVEGGALTETAPWYFIEMNTRLQVEHPVTEEITGLDLVEWQFRVAAGEPLPLAQDQIAMRGHAIEMRLCAEDPANGFRPSVGKIWRFEPPQEARLRVEAGIRDHGEDEVSPFYDSMIAKLIATAPDRASALSWARSGLKGTRLYGLKTNAAFLHDLLGHEEVAHGTATTDLIGRILAGAPAAERDDVAIAAAACALVSAGSRDAGEGDPARADPWSRADGFQLGGTRAFSVALDVEGEPATVRLEWAPSGLVAHFNGISARASSLSELALVRGRSAYAIHKLRHTTVSLPSFDLDAAETSNGGGRITAPITGKIVRILVAKGAEVAKGDKIAVIEAMKMEHVLTAAIAGSVDEIAAGEGQQVAQGTLIVHIVEAS